MKRIALLIGMSLMAAPAHADITHRMSTSVQLTVDAAASQATRIGNSYAISGNNITTTDGTTAGSLGGLGTITHGQATAPGITASQATSGESFSFSTNFTQGDTNNTTSTTVSSGVVGALPLYGNTTTTAGGVAGSLAGTIDSSSTMALTAGGAGTSATGQFVTEITVK